MKTLTRLYFEQPETVRKYERDFVVLWAGLMLATGTLDGNTPDLRLLAGSAVASATLAAWRIGRGILDKLTGGALPPEPQ